MSEEINSIELVQLPTNVLVEIARYFNLTEICLLARVCQRLKEISENLNLWFNFLPGIPLEDKRSVFIARSKITRHIYQRVVIPYILQGHSDMILNLDVQGSNVLSSSRDNTVKRWNIATKKGKNYEGHADWVTAAKFCEGGIVSVSSDRSVRLWRDDGEEVKMQKGHKAGVTCLKMVTPTLAVTGSYDTTVKLWNLQTARLRKNFTAHCSPIGCMDVFENFMVTGTVLDGKVFVHDLETGEVATAFQT